MKMARGAGAMLLFVLIVSVAQCSSQRSGTEAANAVPAGKVRMAMVNGAQTEICPGKTCTVTLIVNDDNDIVEARPDRAVVVAGQDVQWEAQSTTQSRARVKKIHFVRTTEKSGSKKNIHDHADPSCWIWPFNRCTVDNKDFVEDVPYYYVAKVQHKHEKTLDPEMVVAGTVTIVDIPPPRH